MEIEEYIEKEGIDLSEKTTEDLRKYADILLKWNKIHNLTGSESRDSVYKNIIDSLYLKKLIPVPGSLIDVGSGAGFPGIVLAAVWRSSRIVLCEPRSKRAAFLRYVALELDMNNVTVLRDRIENASRGPYDVISSRAVMNTASMLDVTEHLRDDKSRYILLKGENVHRELEDVCRWKFSFNIFERKERSYLTLWNVSPKTCL